MAFGLRISRSLSVIQNSRNTERWGISTFSLRAVNIWNEDADTMDVMVEGNKSAQVAGIFHDNGIAFTIAISEVLALLHAQKSQVKSVKAIPEPKINNTSWKPKNPKQQNDTENTPSSLRKPPGSRSTSVSDQPKNSSCTDGEADASGRPPTTTHDVPGDSKVPVMEEQPAMCWYKYHRLDTIYAFMYKLAKDFPHICSVQVIGRSAEGRDMLMLKISDGNPSNEGVWLDGAIHPREWISVAVVTYIANSVVRSFTSFKRNVRSKDWFILPVMNPDGYEYTHTTDRMWRKNRVVYGQCVGVDLNRNFSCGWAAHDEEGSSDDPGSVFYRGPSAFSEPESVCVKHQIMDSTTKFKVFISFHSYGEVIIFPWGHTVDPCEDYVELLEGGTAFARGIHESSGRTYRVGSTKDLMYFAAGTSVDWCYGVAGIPFCYMIELRSKTTRFLLPTEEIMPTAKEVFNGLLKLLDFVDKSSLTASSCKKKVETKRYDWKTQI